MCRLSLVRVGVFTPLPFIRYASTSYIPALVTAILSEILSYSYPFYQVIDSKEKSPLERGFFKGVFPLPTSYCGSPFGDVDIISDISILQNFFTYISPPRSSPSLPYMVSKLKE
jgi:hypothetical protein